MNVLIGCECTGTTRDAFIAAGHNAYSCDILPDQNGNDDYHFQGDIIELLKQRYGIKWDLFIVHPDRTYLTCSAEWAYKERDQINKNLSPDKLYGAERLAAREQALQFVRDLIELSVHIPMVCIENPAINKINTVIKKPSQVIHPHQFGHDASKQTGLWLKGLPHLLPTQNIDPRYVCCGHVLNESEIEHGCLECFGDKKPLPRWSNQTDSGQNRLPPSKDRWLIRATTYQGWSDAMVNQWGNLIKQEEIKQ